MGDTHRFPLQEDPRGEARADPGGDARRFDDVEARQPEGRDPENSREGEERDRRPRSGGEYERRTLRTQDPPGCEEAGDESDRMRDGTVGDPPNALTGEERVGV